MMPDEKAQLLALLERESSWCRDAEARDSDGRAVHFDDNTAVAWDITGALCRLFGWQRACELFRQLERHILGKPKAAGWPVPDPSIGAMKSLQEFNDHADTTLEMIREAIEKVPAWHGQRPADVSAAGA